jgi:hypothetical protein
VNVPAENAAQLPQFVCVPGTVVTAVHQATGVVPNPDTQVSSVTTSANLTIRSVLLPMLSVTVEAGVLAAAILLPP